MLGTPASLSLYGRVLCLLEPCYHITGETLLDMAKTPQIKRPVGH